MRYGEKQIEETYGLVSELGHDSLERGLILFQQAIELLVLMLQCLVLNNDSRVHPLQLRLENLCVLFAHRQCPAAVR